MKLVCIGRLIVLISLSIMVDSTKTVAVWCVLEECQSSEAGLSAKSFLETGGENALIIVSSENEGEIAENIVPEADILVLPKREQVNEDADKVFQLQKFFEKFEHGERTYYIICDNNVVWKKFDENYFLKIKHDLWFERAIFYDSRWLLSKIPFARQCDSTVQTLRAANKYIECRKPLEVRLDVGLYGGRSQVLKKLIGSFSQLLLHIPLQKRPTPEALLSYIIPNLNFTVCSCLDKISIDGQNTSGSDDTIWTPTFQIKLDRVRSRSANLSRIHLINAYNNLECEMANRLDEKGEISSWHSKLSAER